MANYNYSFTFFVCFCFGLLILFVDFVILLYLILICHSYCLRLFVSFPFRWYINSVSEIVFLFSSCVFFLFSLLAYRFGSCVSVLGLRLSVFLFCFYRPQYKLNRYSVASKSNHWRQLFTRQRISRADFIEIVYQVRKMLIQFGIFQTWEAIFLQYFFGHVPLYVVSYLLRLFIPGNNF